MSRVESVETMSRVEGECGEQGCAVDFPGLLATVAHVLMTSHLQH